MMKPVESTLAPTPTDGMSASTHAKSLMEQQEVKRINNPVKGLIFITNNDKKRLLELLSVAKITDFRDHIDINGLEVKLKRAFGVDAREVAGDIITMNSRAELIDLDTEERVTFAVVFPRDADIERGRISVLAPQGAAMLGCRVDDEFEWKGPYDLRRFKVTKILYQPEAVGDYER